MWVQPNGSKADAGFTVELTKVRSAEDVGLGETGLCRSVSPKLTHRGENFQPKLVDANGVGAWLAGSFGETRPHFGGNYASVQFRPPPGTFGSRVE